MPRKTTTSIGWSCRKKTSSGQPKALTLHAAKEALLEALHRRGITDSSIAEHLDLFEVFVGDPVTA